MFKFGIQLFVAFGLVIGLTAISSSSAAAKEAAAVNVTHNYGFTADQADGRCQVLLEGTWNPALTPGPTVTVQLFVSINGGALQRAGYLERVTDSGWVQFEQWPTEGAEHRYEVRITKGPKHVVAIGLSDTVRCAGTPEPGA